MRRYGDIRPVRRELVEKVERLRGERAAHRAAAGFAASLRQQPVPLHRFLNEPRETALERRAANLLRDLRPPEQENGRIVRSFFVRIFRNGA